jgi:glycine/D-amino acid oxidase-like deaminating enzyme
VNNDSTVIGRRVSAIGRAIRSHIASPIPDHRHPANVNPQSHENAPVWDDHAWYALPSLASDLTTDVCVIGLGGSGLTAVSELLELGRRVVAIDAADVAAGAAGRNGGILRAGVAAFHHDAVRTLGRERATRLYHMTEDEIRRIASEFPDVVRLTGSLRLATSDAERIDCERQRDAMRADSIRVDDYDGPLGRGLFFPANAALNPLARCRALAQRAMARGASLYGRTAAVAIRGTEVRTPGGRIRCEAVIVAVDGGLDTILPELAGAVRTARLQMVATEPTQEVRIPCPVSARNGFDYWQQLPDGAVVLGGGRDRAMDDEWTSSGEPTAATQDYLERTLREVIGVHAPITHRWAASVSYSSSGLPILSAVRPAVWAAGAYCGTGNLLGALCGRAAARMACGETPELAYLLGTSTATEPI